jgi:hypothetical protein
MAQGRATNGRDVGPSLLTRSLQLSEGSSWARDATEADEVIVNQLAMNAAYLSAILG